MPILARAVRFDRQVTDKNICRRHLSPTFVGKCEQRVSLPLNWLWKSVNI